MLHWDFIPIQNLQIYPSDHFHKQWRMFKKYMEIIFEELGRTFMSFDFYLFLTILSTPDD